VLVAVASLAATATDCASRAFAALKLTAAITAPSNNERMAFSLKEAGSIRLDQRIRLFGLL
ncbi:MAG: hypothetical protein V4656_12120, partial [Pseudomonadota bacterium]